MIYTDRSGDILVNRDGVWHCLVFDDHPWVAPIEPPDDEEMAALVTLTPTAPAVGAS
jgi:hypothetical protein